MEDRGNSENEKLRKQIQFLTDIIKNAKSERSYGNETNYGGLRDEGRATNNKHWQSSKGHKSQIVRGHSYPRSASTAGAYHWDASHNKKPGQTSLHHSNKYKNSASLLTSDVGNDEKKVFEKRFTANESRLDNFKDAVGKNTVDKEVSTQLKMDLPSQVKREKAENPSAGNSSACKSNPKLLKKEIEVMHSKISELQKLISLGKVTSNLEDRITHNNSSSGGFTRSNKMVCALPDAKLPVSAEREVSLAPQGKPTLKKPNFAETKSHSVPGVYQGYSVPTCHGNRNTKSTVAGLQKGKVLDPTFSAQKSDESNKQLPSDLISVSKYKLTRIGSSPIKQASMSADLSIKQEISSVHTNPVSSSFDVASASGHVSNQKQYAGPDLKPNTVIDMKTPLKFVKRSKYSITKVMTSGKKRNPENKPTRRHSNTPAKFVRLSKYAIKRVRRSLSDESKQKSSNVASIHKRTGQYRKINHSHGSVQNNVSIVKSKFKIEKIPLPNLIAKGHRTRQESYYKYGRNRFYRQRDHYMYKHTGRYRIGQYRDTRHGVYGYTKRGGYSNRYIQGGRSRSYQYSGRQHRPAWYPAYNRRQDLSQRYIQRRLQSMKEKVPFNPKHKLDRRTVGSTSKKPVNFVMINGMLYRSSAKVLEKAMKTPDTSSNVPHRTMIKKSATSNMKTVTVRGVKFEVGSHGRSLKRVTQHTPTDGKTAGSALKTGHHVSRIDIGGVVYMQTKPGTLERVGSVKTRVAATRVVNKTVQRAAAKYKKDNTKVKKMKKNYCMFYNRFGKCNKKGDCPYIHDSEKVAVCTRFLRGTCKVKDCPFSHKVSKEKMPVCSYFLKGVCNRDDCPYLHVNVNRDAKICDDFLRGYCPKGEKCTKKHILTCPEFAKTGVCSNGDKCKLQHRKTRKRKLQTSSETVLDDRKKPKADGKTTDVAPVDEKPTISSCAIQNVDITAEEVSAESDTSVNLPFKERKLPAYISLKTTSNDSKQNVIVIQEDQEKKSVKPVIQIRPQL